MINTSENLIGVKGDHPICIGRYIWGINTDLSYLESAFTEEEIKKATWDLAPEKNICSRWISHPILQKVLVYNQKRYNKLMHEMYNGCARLDRLNYAKVVLIPKKGMAETSGDYRPISLVNCSMKIISKSQQTD